jgi:simple sugar transport system ATP-binding protein
MASSLPAPAGSDTTAAVGTEDVPPALEARHVGMKFGSVTALNDINLTLAKGEVLGLIGDNGAGKSTLIKILTGYYKPTSGELLIDGSPVSLSGIADARDRGIETVFQDLALINTLPVYMNLFLNKEPRFGPFLRRSLMRNKARSYLDDIGIRIASVNDEVSNLSGGQRQAIAVARSVYSNASILLLDEPLAAMGAKEGGIILDLVSMLREKGDVSILLIAHNYTQVFDVCDRVNLLQHGEITLNKRTDETSAEEVLELVASEYRRGGKLAGDRGKLLNEARKSAE